MANTTLESITGDDAADVIVLEAARTCLELAGSGKPFGTHAVMQHVKTKGVTITKQQAMTALERMAHVADAPELVPPYRNSRELAGFAQELEIA